MGLLTVIITVHNRADFLARGLLCLASQSIRPDELIISDDGSSGEMIETIKKFIPELKMRVKYVRQEHKGFRLSRSRNNAVRIAEGDHLIFLDQDIIYTKNYFRTFVDHLRPGRFQVAWPIRLTLQQTEQLTDKMIIDGNFHELVTSEQVKEVRQQYRRDTLYHFLKKYRLRQIGPKLRGGVCLVNREDYVRINGYDERYQGWGNEDDDMGRRLHQSGVLGLNPFESEFPVHMYHAPYREGEKRVNQEYYLQRKAAIHKKNDMVCEFGLVNPLEDDELSVINL